MNRELNVKKFFAVMVLLVSVCGFSGAQRRNSTSGPYLVPPNPVLDDPSLLIGVRVEELLEKLGPPESVYPVRGLEAWQDDVVFVYSPLDVYVYRDRVWQVAFNAAYGVRVGDSGEQAKTALNSFTAIASPPRTGGKDNAGAKGFSLFFTLPNRNWPVVLRVYLSGSEANPGTVAALFVFRSDY